MDQSRHIAMLVDLLANQRANVTALLELLNQERSALRQNDTAELEVLAAEKETQIGNIDANDQRRVTLLKAAGYENNQAGMQQLIARLGNEPVLLDTWNGLLDDLTECKKLNEINGGSIELVKRHLQRAISIVNGQSQSPSLYNDSGISTSQHTGHTIAKA